MDGGCGSCRVPAKILIGLLLLVATMVRLASSQDPDTTPPNVTCTDVTTKPFLPNSFLGLDVGSTYTYEDLNPDPSGVTYNVTTGSDGDLFPPGRTPVTMYAVDLFDNRATCLFYVENTLKELPVDCPIINDDINDDIVATYIRWGKYKFSRVIGPEMVTKSNFGYRYHGSNVSVFLEVKASNIGSPLDLGTLEVTISDDVLRKTCVEPIQIFGRPLLSTVVFIVVAVIVVTVFIAIILCRARRAWKRAHAN